MWQDFAVALCLVLVFEGMLPFLTPQHWRQTIMQISRLSDQQLRIMGFVSMLIGTLALYFVR